MHVAFPFIQINICFPKFKWKICSCDKAFVYNSEIIVFLFLFSCERVFRKLFVLFKNKINIVQLLIVKTYSVNYCVIIRSFSFFRTLGLFSLYFAETSTLKFKFRFCTEPTQCRTIN